MTARVPRSFPLPEGGGTNVNPCRFAYIAYAPQAISLVPSAQPVLVRATLTDSGSRRSPCFVSSFSNLTYRSIVVGTLGAGTQVLTVMERGVFRRRRRAPSYPHTPRPQVKPHNSGPRKSENKAGVSCSRHSPSGGIP